MKIIIIKNGTNTQKEFYDKEEFFEFVKSNIESTIFSDSEKENLKARILNTENYNKFAIKDLITLIDYKIKK